MDKRKQLASPDQPICQRAGCKHDELDHNMKTWRCMVPGCKCNEFIKKEW